jgi:hypothetical protein
MAKSVRISDAFYALLELEARLEHRSIAQQLEYWAKLGMSRTRASVMEMRADYAVEAAIETTRKLDIQDVQSGLRDASDLHFVPKSIARRSELVFPDDYQKSGK